MQRQTGLLASSRKDSLLTSNNPLDLKLSLAKKMFWETLSKRLGTEAPKIYGDYRTTIDKREVVFAFAAPSKKVAVEIVVSDDFVDDEKLGRATDDGWAMYVFRVDEILNSQPDSQYMLDDLLVSLGVQKPKKYLCEFSGGWEDGAAFRVFTAVNSHGLNEQIKAFLAQEGLGTPESYPNERRAGQLRYMTVHAYEIAGTSTFDVSKYVGDMEEQEMRLFNSLRTKYEGNEDELKTYQRLKARYGPKPVPPKPPVKTAAEWGNDWA